MALKYIAFLTKSIHSELLSIKKNSVLVIGSNGQLANAIRSAGEFWAEQFELLFAGSAELDIRNEPQLTHFVELHQPNVIINCAAYTNVDRAEDEADEAMLLNATAAGYLAKAASAIGAIMVHISTDYVFDGLSENPYTEEDVVGPISVYGMSKQRGEQLIRENCVQHYIVRTSWLYGNHGNNFLNTMLRLAQEKKELSIVTDQIASPTWVGDLSKALYDLLKKALIDTADIPFGTWHFSNQGEASWYDFAAAIFSMTEKQMVIHHANAMNYPTKAKRPHYSKLNCTKWEAAFGEIPHWKVALLKCLNERRLQMC